MKKRSGKKKRTRRIYEKKLKDKKTVREAGDFLKDLLVRKEVRIEKITITIDYVEFPSKPAKLAKSVKD